MRRMVGLAVLLGLGWIPFLLADAPAKKPLTTSAVEQLIDRLGSKDAKVREAAGKTLHDLGSSALPALQKGRATADPEVRRRLDEMIPVLEKEVALRPKLVTLHMTNKPVRDAVNELAKQTGYKLEAQGNGGPVDRTLYTFHFDKVPFWEAIDKICDATGMMMFPNFNNPWGGWGGWWGGWGDDTMRLWPADSYVPFNYCKGPFKVMVTGFNYTRNNNFAQLPKNTAELNQQSWEALNANLTLAVEPKLPIIKMGAPRLLVAEDDENHSMLPTGNNPGNGMWQRQYWGWGNPRMFFMQTSAPLAWPSKTAKMVKTLKGSIPVTLLADQKPAVVTEKLLSAKGKKFKAGNTSFHIQDVNELPGKQYQLTLSITEEGKDNNPNDWTRFNSLQQRLEFHDDKGNKHNFYFNMVNNNGPSVQFQLTIQPPGPKLGPPTKLVYYAWDLMEHDVEFEFHDLPLP